MQEYGAVPGGAEGILYSPEETAGVMGITRTAVYAMLRGGELSSVKIGRRRLIPRTVIEAYVARLIAAGAGREGE
jgi:excisionase family DNA binding protein